jgi:hypothetical protein
MTLFIIRAVLYFPSFYLALKGAEQIFGDNIVMNMLFCVFVFSLKELTDTVFKEP